MAKPKYKSPYKTHAIKIFSEVIGIDSDNKDYAIKAYIHPEGTYLKAYVRQLSAFEKSLLNAEQDASNIEFTINPRDIVQGMIVEFNGKNYQIGAPDNFEFFNTEIKFRAHEVNKRTYTSTTYKAWGIE